MNFDELDRMGAEDEQIFDLYLKRWRTTRKTGTDGAIFVRDGNEVGTWLQRGEYSSVEPKNNQFGSDRFAFLAPGISGSTNSLAEAHTWLKRERKRHPESGQQGALYVRIDLAANPERFHAPTPPASVNAELLALVRGFVLLFRQYDLPLIAEAERLVEQGETILKRAQAAPVVSVESVKAALDEMRREICNASVAGRGGNLRVDLALAYDAIISAARKLGIEQEKEQ